MSTVVNGGGSDGDSGYWSAKGGGDDACFTGYGADNNNGGGIDCVNEFSRNIHL